MLAQPCGIGGRIIQFAAQSPQIVHKETAVAGLSDKFSQTALVSTLVVKPCATHAIQDLEDSLVDQSEMSSVGSARPVLPLV